MNKVTLIGRVGKTPEVSVFDNGKKVTKFSLATTEFFGEKTDTTWHNITVWGDYGEKMAKYIEVGSQIAIEGRIQNSAYEKDGVKSIYSVVVGEKIELLNSKKSEATTDHEQATVATETTTAPTVTKKVTKPVSVPAAPDASDDLPF